MCKSQPVGRCSSRSGNRIQGRLRSAAPTPTQAVSGCAHLCSSPSRVFWLLGIYLALSADRSGSAPQNNRKPGSPAELFPTGLISGFPWRGRSRTDGLAERQLRDSYPGLTERSEQGGRALSMRSQPCSLRGDAGAFSRRSAPPPHYTNGGGQRRQSSAWAEAGTEIR